MSKGQSVVDRIVAAKHTVTGSGLAKSVCKATTEEVMGPKKKHLDYLLQCTNEPNVSIPALADLLIQRTQNTSWVISFKALISVHHLMNYGNERFTQYLASNNCTFNLANFMDRTNVQGYDMSTFIRRYSKYMNEKAISYRQMAFDFCKVKRGKEDGMLRTMDGAKLLKTLPALQTQVDALLQFDCSSNELTNGVINSCFLLLFKDLIRLFACYNDGIINLLEKYFEMNKKQCKEALDIYKKFLVRMDKVAEFLKVAENVGIDKGDIPDLAKAPSSLLEALEAHLNSMDKKGVTVPTGPIARPSAVQTAINTLSSTVNANRISEDEKQRLVDEENQRLQQLKDEQLRHSAHTSPVTTPPSHKPQPVMAQVAAPQAPHTSNNVDLFGGSPQHTAEQSKPSSDLDLLNMETHSANPFQQQIHNVMALNTATNAFGAAAQPNNSASWGVPPSTSNNGFASDSSFAAAFGSPTNQPQSGFDGFGEVLRPQGSNGVNQQSKNDKLITDMSIDNSLANLASNLNMNGPAYQVKKTQHEWKPKGESKLTGGTNFQAPPRAAATATTWQAPPVQQPMGMMAAPVGVPMVQPGFAPMPQYGMQPMGMPATGMGYYGQQVAPPMYGQVMAAQQPVNTFQQPNPPMNTANDPFGAL